MRAAFVLLIALTAMPGLRGLYAQRLAPNPFAGTEWGHWTGNLGTPGAVSGLRRPVPQAAQQFTTARAGSRSSDDVDGPKLVMGGIFGGLAGLVAGALLMRAGSGECTEFECFAPIFYGAMAGESVGVPLGVHLANGRQGRYGPSLAASLAIGGAGLAGAIVGDEPRLLLVIPILQIAAAVGLERRTAQQ